MRKTLVVLQSQVRSKQSAPVWFIPSCRLGAFVILTASVKEKAALHAEREYPRESCGLVVHVRGMDIYWPCLNLAQGDEHFVLCPHDYAAADDAGDIVAVIHSHPDGLPTPSETDMKAQEESELPWFIIGKGNKWGTV